MMKKQARILLQDGTRFAGYATGMDGTASGEVCFNTGMTGYQEIFTDPSYKGQIMVTAASHIGNYGVTLNESEHDKVQIAGLICRSFSDTASRARSDQDLASFLADNQTVAVSDVDTRALVRHLREKGSMNGVISTELDWEAMEVSLKGSPSMDGLELCSQVSTQTVYTLGDKNAPYHVAALDLGVKRNILNCLVNEGCHVTVYPYDTDFGTLSASQPDGYFLSNGPGDPSASLALIETTKSLIASGKPVFGICLGHQMIALANGLSTFKMHHGHRGINHPVKNLLTGKGEITSQNHGFAVNMDDVMAHDELELTHKHLNDGTVAGIRMTKAPVFSVQYHPEASPGPHDSRYLFKQFTDNMSKK